MTRVLTALLFMMMTFAMGQQVPSLPYMPSVITDAKGHEWYIEQNGVLQRNGGGASMISNCMTLQFAGQQFYTQQPMTTPDGKEIMMRSQQPLGGISITRRITVLEREGALRYVDEFMNTTGRDLTITVEVRHGLNNSAREVVSNLGRTIKDGLEAGESGVLALPAESDNQAPALFLSFRAPKSAATMRLRVQNKYQISASYTLTIPAGQVQSLIHGIAQIKLGAKATTDEMVKACTPFAMTRLLKGLPKSVIKTAANLGAADGGYGLEEWLPKEFWGIMPGSSDQLALGKESLLKGQGTLSGLAILREGGKSVVEPGKVAAMAGPVFTGDGTGWLWLRDGQRWLGALEAGELRFTLNSGAELPVLKLDRLVFAKDAEPEAPLGHTMIELLSGERIAIAPEGDLQAGTPWGRLSVPWAEVIALLKTEGETLGGLLCLRDGTRVRALPQAGKMRMKTVSLGEQEMDLADLRRMITPLALTMGDDDAEPATSFLDLVGDQRVVARVTATTLTIMTEAGPLTLAPSSIHELRDVSEDENAPVRVFEADLWGGGVVKGSLEEPRLRVEGRGFGWDIATQQIRRLVNPVPVTDNALMRRIGQLIQDLGHEQWKTREAASTALRELGPLARGSLQEAQKSATDAEVARRLEELLQDPP
jgi:hypothetical protein